MEVNHKDTNHQTEEPLIIENAIHATKPAIVLDLDDTIINSSMIKTPTFSYPIKVGNHRRAYIKTRPGLHEFLKEVSLMFEIFFFTSSSKIYANQIIDIILPDTPSSNRFFRTSCQNIFGYSVKDLSLINRPMNKILLIDDMHGSAILQPENLIRITPWDGNQNDTVLLNQLLPILSQIKEEINLPLAFKKIHDKDLEKYHDLKLFR